MSMAAREAAAKVLRENLPFMLVCVTIGTATGLAAGWLAKRGMEMESLMLLCTVFGGMLGYLVRDAMHVFGAGQSGLHREQKP